MATLTTSPQLIGSNTGNVIQSRLYAWYDNQNGNSCTVHVRLTATASGLTYTGTNKSYFIQIGGYNSGVISWTFAPLNAGVEYTVAEATYTYSGGETISASAGVWSWVYGSADITIGSWQVPTFYTNPSTPSVSISSKTYNSATFNVRISSYGNPSSVSGRYIEAGLLSSNDYGAAPRRWNTRSNTTSATITVNNSSSTSSPALTITGNTRYWYGGYASNTQRSVSTVVGTIYLPCPPLSALSLSSQEYSSYNQVKATISYTRQSDGGAETRRGYYRYSTDGGSTYTSWTFFGNVTNTTSTFTVQLPTSASITLQAKLNTANGGDSTTKSTTFSTKTTHTAPNFSDFTYQDTSTAAVKVSGDDQIFIQAQSQPKVTISAANKATANDGTTITGYTAMLNSQSIQIPYSASADVSGSFSANTPNAYGTLALTVAANDSLNLAKSVSKNVVVIPWSAPVITATAVRVNNFEAQTTLSISGSYSPISVNGEVKNTLAVSYRYKRSTDSEWGEWIDRPITIEESIFTAVDLILSFDNEKQWDIEVKATDAFTTTQIAITLPVGKPIFFISANGKCSINRKPTNSNADLDVEGLIYSKDEPVLTSHVGMIIFTKALTTAEAVREKYGGYWAADNSISATGVYCWRRTS